MSQDYLYPATTTVLPAGGATSANQVIQISAEQAIQASVASLDTKQPTVGQKTMALSSPVVIASDQSAVPVSGTVAVTGVATAANQATQITAEQAIQVSVASLDTKQPTVGQKTMAASSPVVIASDQASFPVTVAAGSAVIGHVIVDSGAINATLQAGSAIAGKFGIDQTTPGTTNGVQVNAALPAGANVIGKTSIDQTTPGTTNLVALTAETTKVIGTVNVAAAQTIAATNAGTFLVQNNAATATATLSNVASSATSVTILASNASRKGAMIYNDSTAVLYIKFGATASATSYVVQIPSLGYYELPAAQYLYTGIIDGIWASANGNARVTELS